MSDKLKVALKKVVEISNKSDLISIEELNKSALEICAELTESEVAFSISVNPEHNIITRQMCVSNVGQSVEISDQINKYHIGTSGILFELIDKKQSLIQNHCELMDCKELFYSYENVTRFLLVPLIENGIVFSIIGVTNKEDFYDDIDDEVINLIFVTIGNIIRRKRVEKQIIASEEIISNAIQNGPLIMSITDIETGKIVEVNENFLDVFGFKKEEVIGQTAIGLGLINGEIRQQMKETLLSKGRLNRIELEVKKKNGEKIICLFSGAVINIDSSPKFLSIVEDITDTKKIYIKSIESEEKFRSVFKYANSGIAIGDRYGKFIDLNEKFEKISGFKKDELLEMNFGDLTCPEDLIIEMSYYEEILNGKRNHYRLQKKYNTKSGIKKWVDLSVTTIRNESRDVEYFIGVVNDIDAEKKSKEALKESEEKYRLLYENAGVGISYFDIDGNVISINNHAASYLNVIPEQVAGKSIYELVSREDADKYITRFEETKNSESSKIYEDKFTYQESEIWFLTTLNKVVDKDKVIGIQVISKDITDLKVAEKKIRKSEEKFRLLFENQVDGYAYHKIITDENGKPVDYKFININKGFEKHTGKSASEIIGKTVLELWPGVEDYWIEKYGNVALTGEPMTFENFAEPFGRYYQVNAYSPKKGYFAVSFADITERVLAEKALKESEEKYKELVEKAGVAIAVDNKEGNLVYHNEQFAELFEYSIDEMGKIDRLSFVHDDYLGFIKENHSMRLSGFDAPENYVFKGVKKNKENNWVEVFTTPIKKNNEVVGTRNYCFDITEKMEQEKRIRFLNQAVIQSPVSIVITDKSGTIEYVNPQFIKSTGYCLEEVIGQNPKILKSEKLEKDFYKKLWNTILSGKVWSGTFHNKKKNGELFWESALISPIMDNENNISHFVSVQEDITDRINAENELRTYRENLEKLVEKRTDELVSVNIELEDEIKRTKNTEKKLQISLEKEKELGELKSRFISTASHEFRTPLTAILTSAELIELLIENNKKDKTGNHIRRIRRSIEYLTSLIDDILILNKQETGVISFNPEMIKITQIVRQIFNDIFLSVTDEHTLLFDTDLDEDSKFFLDPKLFTLICSNLLTNAIKYSPDGGEIKLCLSKNNGKVLLSVTDQGSGISERDQRIIFNQFERGENTQNIPGTGLGLSIVKRSVELHSGTIELTSRLGEGSKFNVELPAIKEQE